MYTLCKIAFRLKKVCYKVYLCENCHRQSCKAFIGLTVRAKMIGRGRGRPLLPYILGQTDRVGVKSPIFYLFSLVAPQPWTSTPLASHPQCLWHFKPLYPPHPAPAVPSGSCVSQCDWDHLWLSEHFGRHFLTCFCVVHGHIFMKHHNYSLPGACNWMTFATSWFKGQGHGLTAFSENAIFWWRHTGSDWRLTVHYRRPSCCGKECLS